MPKSVLHLTIWLSLFLVLNIAVASGKMLIVEVRNRPPEMIVDGEKMYGPLLDIIDQAAHNAGYRIRYNKRQFQASLRALESGQTDILPRTLCNEQRAKLIDFLGPIGFQKKVILFLVKTGKENTIEYFNDLEKLKVGVKRGTFYFEQFNENSKIHKIESSDDDNMVKMFAAGRFDTMAVLDKKPLESALHKHDIHNFAYAKYRYPLVIGNYYGIRKSHLARKELQKALMQMVSDGSIARIYQKYGLTPPIFDTEHEPMPCIPGNMN